MSKGSPENLRKIRKSFTGLGFMPVQAGINLTLLCEEIAARARTLVPVDTGELKASIEVQRPGHFNRFSGKKNITASVVVNSDHAAAVEYGTDAMEAQPFFRPAIAGAKGELKAFVHDAVEAAIIRARR